MRDLFTELTYCVYNSYNISDYCAWHLRYTLAASEDGTPFYIHVATKGNKETTEEEDGK